MTKGIWIFIEHHDGSIRKVSLELLNQARIIAQTTGDPIVALVLGKDISSVGETAESYGADKVILVEDEKLAQYTTGAYTSVLNKLIREEPNAVLQNTAGWKGFGSQIGSSFERGNGVRLYRYGNG